MGVRLSGIEDLIASEGKYHLKCLVVFERKTTIRMNTMSQPERDKTDNILDQLGENLANGLARGNVYNMSIVWDTYSKMCKERGIRPANRFISRRSTFKDAISERVGQKASFVRPLGKTSSHFMYPRDKSKFVIAKTLTHMTENDDDIRSDLVDDTKQDHTLHDIVHTALQLRNDLAETPGHSGAWGGIDETGVDKVIPDNVYTFLSVLFGGTAVLESDECEVEMKRLTCSIAQDIVFAASRGKKLTPKHVGLGMTLHQATRSEKLVSLFHAAGHCIGMDRIRRMDTTIANDILDEYERNECVYIPSDIVPYESGRLIVSSCDNIDVLEETLDGKNTFHCTQMVVWQRGPPPQRPACEKVVKQDRALTRERLEKLHQLDNAKLPTGSKPSPQFHEECQIQPETWFHESEERNESKLKDGAWILSRMEDEGENVPNWSTFNAVITDVNPPVTTAGMLPILQAPADDNDTMTTVINRFVSITTKLGQKHTVLVADQPLYSRAKTLIWADPTKYMDVVVLLGDLHILFNFLKAIGKHLESSGLVDIWVESGLFAEKSTDAMMNGKAYYRTVRGHMLAYEALSRIWWSKFGEWLNVNHGDLNSLLHQQVRKVVDSFIGSDDSTSDTVSQLVKGVLNDPELQRQKQQFSCQVDAEPNYKYWQNYMDMIEILLDFIKANRDGNWELHLDAFSAMLPWMTIYDHTNYARWRPVYMADMKGLESTAPEVHMEFMAGNFVVKRSRKRFNQVPVDQATEWMNRMCKISNGIIGITRNDTARDRFCATWAERSHISHATRLLYGLMDDEEDQQCISTEKASVPSRQKYDCSAVQQLVEMFQRFNVFKVGVTKPMEEGMMNHDHEYDTAEQSTSTDSCEIPVDENIQANNTAAAPSLISLTSNDVATKAIQADLLTAGDRGMVKVLNHVTERLVDRSVPCFDPIKRNDSRTFASLYNCTTVNEKNEKKVVKADRKLIQKLLTAAQAGRTVQMNEILKHELSPVPMSLAKLDGGMNTAHKSDMLSLLATDHDIESPPTTDQQEEVRGCIIIDGHAVIQALGKPASCQTFDDYADLFVNLVLRKLTGDIKRVDVVFDRYIGTESIKSMTRGKRSCKTKRPIRKIIDCGTVPLPHSWSQFIMLEENKADLAHFLSRRIIEYGARLGQQYEVVTAGGYEDSSRTISTRRSNITQLAADHEEADTRIILHAIEAITSGYSRVVVECRDTDVILLMIHHLGPLDADVWMIGGTAKKRKYYSVSEMYSTLEKPVVDNILGFHALTGCDTTSSFTGHGKKTCWKIFKEQPELLSGVGRDGSLEDVEEFVCHIHRATYPLDGVDRARNEMFQKGKKTLEALPPSNDALQLHLYRANYQAKIWLPADTPHMDVGSPVETGGWKRGTNGIEIVWSTIPSVPTACIELISCGCTTKCKMASCKCSKSGQICTPACECNAEKCRNPVGL